MKDHIRRLWREIAGDVIADSISILERVQATCPFCSSPEFDITSIQGAIVTCHCTHCYNVFPTVGDWAFVDVSDKIKVRRVKGDD